MAIDKTFNDGEILYASYLNDFADNINTLHEDKLNKTAIRFENGYLYITIESAQEE